MINPTISPRLDAINLFLSDPEIEFDYRSYGKDMPAKMIFSKDGEKLVLFHNHLSDTNRYFYIEDHEYHIIPMDTKVGQLITRSIDDQDFNIVANEFINDLVLSKVDLATPKGRKEFRQKLRDKFSPIL